jgi:ABC-2 type transport system permease protein
MKNIWRVLVHEFMTTVTRPSFYVGLILVAVGSVVVFSIATAAGDNPLEGIFESMFMPTASEGIEGYVDQAGVIQQVPQHLAPGLTEFDDEQQALAALEAQEISGFYIIPPDYLTSGEIVYVRVEANPFGSMMESERMEEVIKSNLLGNDNRSERVLYPMNLEVRQLTASGVSEDGLDDSQVVSTADTMTAYWIPYAVVFVFYIVLMGASTLMLNNVSAEKSNRMTEILITSVNPTQLLIGKMVGLGAAGLLQTVVWGGTGILLMRYSENQGLLPANLSLPPILLLWLVVFFVLGYALYSSMMASLGALTASSKEAGQLTLIVIFPLIIPMMLINAVTTAPDGPISTAMSLIPFTAPVVMPARIAIIDVPLWQILVSVALLIAVVVFIVRSTSKLFRAQNLLSGDTVSGGNFIKAMLGLKYSPKKE